MTKLVLIVVGLALIGVAIIFGFSFLSTWLTGTKTLTITKDERLSPPDLKIENDKTLKVKNQSDDKQRLVLKGATEEFATIEANKTLEKKDLQADTVYLLSLDANENSETKLVVGEGTNDLTAEEIKTTTPTPTATPSPPSQTATVSTAALPTTGSSEIVFFLLLILSGLGVSRYQYKLLKAASL